MPKQGPSSSPDSALHSLQLLPTKLSVPVASRYVVTRSLIAERVFQSLGIKLVLVRGPAGFGKTTVMLQLRERYQREGIPCAWLNLDEADNDMPRFLTYLEAALESVLQPDGGVKVKGQGRSTSILENISSHRAPFVLFLDECEVIRNPSVMAFVTQFIDSLPTGAQLVVGTRTVPVLGLARLRARGQLLEIDPGQLRFSPDEATDLLTKQRGLPLKADQIRRLLNSTEGWVAALWLASVALEKRANADEFIAGFAGSNAAVADYLAEDVFLRQSDLVREFLLKTSVLDQLTVPLCNAITGREDSEELLARTERANLFLLPLDEARSGYRYHSLFSQFLRAQLRRLHPEWVAPLNRQASDWYLSQGRPIPAITYAVKAGDIEHALGLIDQRAHALLGQGRLRLLNRWFDSLPPEALESRPRLKLVQAWAINFTRGPKEALALIGEMEPDSLQDLEARSQLLALRPMLLGMSDKIDEAHELALQRMPMVSPEFGFARSMLAQALANTSMIRGDFVEARRYADEARKGQASEASQFNFTLADTIEGAIDLMQGRLKQATAWLRRAAGVTGEDLINENSRNAFSGVLLAEVLYEAGHRDRAERLLSVFVPMLQQLGLPDHLITSHVLLARIAGDRGDKELALQLLADLEGTGHRLSLPRVIASARIERARHLVMQADYSAAREQLAQSADPAFWQQLSTRSHVANDLLNYTIGHLRWMVHSGAASDAIPLIKQRIEDADAAGFNRRSLKLRIILSEALNRDGQKKPAMRTLERALDQAAAEGFVSTFVEEGAAVQGMVNEFLQTREEGGAAPNQLATDLMKEMMQSRRLADRAAAVEVQSGAVDSLTPKEIQVLELLSQGYSNDAMAGKLFVSESTVRTHLRNINVKLQAGNRTQALVIARRLKIIA
jgi:LuxR family maltose regulon positive regulatory protein